MSIDESINDLLQGGAKSYSWDEAPIDTVHRLTIISAKKVPQTDYTTKEPKYYKDGNPMVQLRVIGQTDERDPADDTDEGERAEYFHGQKLAELRATLKKAKVKTIAVDGKLAVKLLERKRLDDGTKQNIFAVQYTPPPEPAFDESDPF